MTILSLPSVTVTYNPFNFILVPNIQTSQESPLNKQVQTQEQPGARWESDFTFIPASYAEYRAFNGFIDSLRGKAGRFYLSDLIHGAPLGTPTGTPIVNGASQTGSTLITSGWTHSTTIFAIGDYFAFNSGISLWPELKKITSVITSDGSGNATLIFEPPIRYSPTNGASINVTSPSCVMYLIDSGHVAGNNPYLPHMSVKCAEIFAT